MQGRNKKQIAESLSRGHDHSSASAFDIELLWILDQIRCSIRNMEATFLDDLQRPQRVLRKLEEILNTKSPIREQIDRARAREQDVKR